MNTFKYVVGAIPYGFIALFAVWQAKQPPAGYFNTLAKHAPQSPNEGTGEVWAVAFRGIGPRYISQSDFLLFWAPFVVIPFFMIAILWIMHDWYKAGAFEMLRR